MTAFLGHLYAYLISFPLHLLLLHLSCHSNQMLKIQNQVQSLQGHRYQDTFLLREKENSTSINSKLKCFTLKSNTTLMYKTEVEATFYLFIKIDVISLRSFKLSTSVATMVQYLILLLLILLLL